MPSWSARLHSSTSTSSSNATHSNVSAAIGSDRNAIHNDVPVLIPLDTPARTPPARRTHSRSLSNPFPSLFSSSRKGDKKVSKRDFLDSSDDDDDVTYAPDPRSGSPRKLSQHGAPTEDFLTGKCMTCDSTVRWPRGLKVFRCTVCLTVNDLEPCRESKDVTGHGHPALYEAPRSPDIHRKAVPLSVERTRTIIDRCITTYLRSRLDGINKPLPPPPPPPPGLSVEDFDSHVGERNRTNTVERPVKRTPSPGSKLSSSPRQALNADGRGLSPNQPVGGYVKGNNGLLTPSPPDAAKRYVRRRNLSSSDIPTTPERDRSSRGRGYSPNVAESKSQSESHPSIFRPLEEYIISSFKGCDCLNNSFVAARYRPRAVSESTPPRNLDQNTIPNPFLAPSTFEPDAKTLRLGDIGENSSWWTGDRPHRHDARFVQARDRSPDPSRATVTQRSPRIDWAELAEWYRLIMVAGESWIEKWLAMVPDDMRGEEISSKSKRWDSAEMTIIERDITESRIHAQRTLLKATENLLKRPRRPLKKPEDTRFLLILLANPLLYSPSSSRRQQSAPSSFADERDRSRLKDSNPFTASNAKSSSRREAPVPAGQRASGPGHHSGIVKRILGLISNLPNECHHFFVSWFSRFSDGQFQRTVDLVGSFVTYRLSRQHGRQRSESSKNDNGLITNIPNLTGTTRDTPAQLHAALNGRTPSKSPKDGDRQPVVYSEDWQIRAAARVMSLLFAANNASVPRKRDGILSDQRFPDMGVTTKRHSSSHGQMIPISSFYNTLLDYSDLVADFEAWESKSAKFSFCQYPFFLSIWAKIHILEYDARRQMEVKAREAFFNSILSRKAESQYLVLKVRRDCLVEDSLRGVSEVVGSSQEEIKKGLRIEFLGEEGVDAGGLRKEWFLLLVREVFDPNHGLFIYDDDSQYCYFNPYCFESSEQFFLVGVLLGLAIYNSTILDIALPPFAFKKLLASAPPSSVPAASTSRPNFTLTLDDLAEYRPALAKGLRALLEFDGDVQETFCHDFVAQVDRYGQIVEVPLCPGGERRAVTNANRREFVDLYVHYMLDTAVSRQFEPFKRGFFTVCGGNALSLFRPEEIELLVRGSDEPLDVASLRAVATYENWSTPRPEAEPVVRWFWELFENASTRDQRKLLSFITGSDRIPAMGATNLIIRLACLGGDSPRYPIARTCFNIVGLYRYTTKEKLENRLWGAVINSEGFGLK
ncbi:hypothetical protein VTN00DRAFT_7800 [Thermoascus crustaceus]|uniref:uncharacterized protein n=1 Tax=Thermoascus crustaceus TaxID=5088 RepID=UPI003741F86F